MKRGETNTSRTLWSGGAVNYGVLGMESSRAEWVTRARYRCAPSSSEALLLQRPDRILELCLADVLESLAAVLLDTASIYHDIYASMIPA